MLHALTSIRAPATTLAAAGVPPWTISEYLGHADLKTPQIFAHDAPSAEQVERLKAALGVTPRGGAGRRCSR